MICEVIAGIDYLKACCLEYLHLPTNFFIIKVSESKPMLHVVIFSDSRHPLGYFRFGVIIMFNRIESMLIIYEDSGVVYFVCVVE